MSVANFEKSPPVLGAMVLTGRKSVRSVHADTTIMGAWAWRACSLTPATPEFEWSGRRRNPGAVPRRRAGRPLRRVQFVCNLQPVHARIAAHSGKARSSAKSGNAPGIRRRTPPRWSHNGRSRARHSNFAKNPREQDVQSRLPMPRTEKEVPIYHGILYSTLLELCKNSPFFIVLF